jgi:hypothetical protein
MRSRRRKTTSVRKPGEKLIFADALAEESFAKAKLEYKRLRDVAAGELEKLVCAHPLAGWRTAISSPSRSSTASMSPTMPVPVSSTPRPATAARTSTPGWISPAT